MSEKINKSFLTEEAKSDINEMLDNNSGGGGSFTTQIETSEGLTLGKGTVNEESLTASELSTLKNISGNLVKTGNYNGAFPMPVPVGANLLAANNFNDQYFPTLKPSTRYTVIGFLRVNAPTKKIICSQTNYFFGFTTGDDGKTDWMHNLQLAAVVYNFEDSQQTNIQAELCIAIFEGNV